MKLLTYFVTALPIASVKAYYKYSFNKYAASLAWLAAGQLKAEDGVEGDAATADGGEEAEA